MQNVLACLVAIDSILVNWTGIPIEQRNYCHQGDDCYKQQKNFVSKWRTSIALSWPLLAHRRWSRFWLCEALPGWLHFIGYIKWKDTSVGMGYVEYS